MVKCPICKLDRSILVWKDREYKIFKCKECNVSFLHPIPQNPEKIYNRQYFEKWYLKYYEKRKEYLRKLWKEVKSFVPEKGRAFDVGCGVGIFLEILKEEGWEVSGQEVSPFAINFCKKKGFKVYTEPLNRCNIPPETFDLITMWDVIAHLKDPVLYLESCKKILKPEGIVVIKTPLHTQQIFFLSNLLSFTGKSKSLIHVPAQIFHFDKKSIKNLLVSRNFNVELMKIVEDFRIKFTIFYFLEIFERSILVIGRNKG